MNEERWCTVGRNRDLVNRQANQNGAILMAERGASDATNKVRHANGQAEEVTSGGFLSEQPARRAFESVFARLIATAGIVGVGTALGAILIAANLAGWITGFAVAIVSVALAAMLWRSRRL